MSDLPSIAAHRHSVAELPPFLRLLNRNVQRLLLAVAMVIGCTAELRAGTLTEIRVGFNGEGRVGVQLPITINASELPPSQNVQLLVESLDPAGNLLRDTCQSGIVGADGALTLAGTFRVGRLDGTMTVALVDSESGATLCRQQLQHAELLVETAKAKRPEIELWLMKQDTWCVLTVGELEPLQLIQQKSLSDLSDSDSLPFRVLFVPSIAELPSDRDSMETIDALLMQGDFSVSAEQLNAIRRWTLTGGRLTISAGQNSRELTASPFGQWLDPEFNFEPQPLRVRSQTLASFQSYVPGAKVLTTIGSSVSILRMSAPSLRQILPSIDGPLIGRRSLGNGIVTVVAADLSQKPLSTWKSLPDLYEILVLGPDYEDSRGSRQRGSRISSSGVNDLGTQLAAANDAVPPEQRWSTWVVIAVLAVWILVAGPLDYLLVSRFMRRPHLTWITFPVFVTVGCGAVFLARPSPEQNEIVRQLELLDVTVAGDTAMRRTRSWFSVSSGTTQRSDISVAFTNAGESSDWQDSTLSWYGRPENVYGGMYRQGGAGLGRLEYSRTRSETGDGALLKAVPLPVGGSSAFAAEEYRDLGTNTILTSSLRVAGAGLLEGEFTHQLQAPITDWLIVHGKRVYQPARDATPAERVIPPGQPWTRRTSRARGSDLKAFLNGSRVIPGSTVNGQIVQGQTLQTAYNALGRDPVDILLLTSLFDAAGGSGYAGLQNSQLRHDDLSDVIQLNSALVFGTVEQPLTRLMIDGQETQSATATSIVRLLIPVEVTAAASAARVSGEE